MENCRLVIKFGTSTLTEGTKKLSLPRMADLVRQISLLHSQGNEIVIVSSGAITAGKELLGFPELPKHLPKKQMLSAVGQPRLMAIYEQLFAIYSKNVAQVLLTRTDLTDRHGYLNARGTLDALLCQKIIPIINENDTVATDEIQFGDNDSLSGQVAALIEADVLILLTDQDGLYTGDPRTQIDAKLIEQVETEEIPEEIWQAAGGSRSGLGTGGMTTKLRAADLARRSGTHVRIANGNEENVILRIARKENFGTCFTSLANKIEGRKRYLLTGERATGIIQIDNGAANALKKGGSLLPVGIRSIDGDFDRGDTVRVVDLHSTIIAFGMSNYSARDLSQIIGKKTAEIEAILGFTFGDEVIHHNNMILM